MEIDPIKFKRLVIESILFSSSKFVSIKDLARVVMLSEEEVRKLIAELNDEYSKEHSFEIVEVDGRFKIQLKREFYDIAKDFMERPLTDSELKLVSALVVAKRLEAIKAFRLLGKEYSSVIESLLKKDVIQIVHERGRKYIVPGDRFEEFVEVNEESLKGSK